MRWSASDWPLLSCSDGRVFRSNCWRLTSWRRATSNSWRNSWDSPGGSQRSCPSRSRRTDSITSSQLATQARVKWDKKRWLFNYIFWSKYPDLVRFGTFWRIQTISFLLSRIVLIIWYCHILTVISLRVKKLCWIFVLYFNVTILIIFVLREKSIRFPIVCIFLHYFMKQYSWSVILSLFFSLYFSFFVPFFGRHVRCPGTIFQYICRPPALGVQSCINFLERCQRRSLVFIKMFGSILLVSDDLKVLDNTGSGYRIWLSTF